MAQKQNISIFLSDFATHNIYLDTLKFPLDQSSYCIKCIAASVSNEMVFKPIKKIRGFLESLEYLILTI